MKFTHNKIEYELIVLTVAGSRLYGNSRPDSDWDYRGVMISPNCTKLGILGHVDQIEGIDVYNSLTEAGLKLEYTDDIVIYDINRFCSLAIDNNPNIMDTLCHNYTNAEIAVYNNEKGRMLLDNKDLFLSKKSKFTFSGYAVAQLNRIKSHKKHINEFPDTSRILHSLKDCLVTNSIDFDWIADNFGGEVAKKVTGLTSQNKTSLSVCMTWEDYKRTFKQLDVDKYRIPRLIDYTKAYDLTHGAIDTNNIEIKTSSRLEKDITIAEFIEHYASFRKFGESVISLYTNGKGIFGKEGNLKANDSEFIGEFVCLLSINHNEYKKDKDHINKMWNWKCNRNEKRGNDEDLFGIDLKHLSHLWRLMTKAEELLTIGEYNPEFKGDQLETLKKIRDGSLWGNNSYEEGLKFAEENDNRLNELYKTSTLRSKADVKQINDIILEIRESQ